MRSLSKVLLSVVLLAVSHWVAAENVARVMKGHVISKPDSALSVTMLAKDGSILDITSTNNQGQYKLDLTILDHSGLNDVNQLVLEIRDKSGIRQKYSVADRIKQFGEVVELEPISFSQP